MAFGDKRVKIEKGPKEYEYYFGPTILFLFTAWGCI